MLLVVALEEVRVEVEGLVDATVVVLRVLVLEREEVEVVGLTGRSVLLVLLLLLLLLERLLVVGRTGANLLEVIMELNGAPRTGASLTEEVVDDDCRLTWFSFCIPASRCSSLLVSTGEAVVQRQSARMKQIAAKRNDRPAIIAVEALICGNVKEREGKLVETEGRPSSSMHTSHLSRSTIPTHQ